jgi:hypothetical protein
VAVVIGGLIEIVPLFFIKENGSIIPALNRTPHWNA